MSARLRPLVLLPAAAVACATPERAVAPSAGAPLAMRGGPRAPDAAQAEIQFLTAMPDHHLMAVRMGELCPGRATHEELLALCAGVVTTQREEMARMRAWLAAWYGIDHTPTLSPRDEAALASLAVRDGAAFEIAWMQEMIPHHNMAIMMAMRLSSRATHPELRELARTIIATQSAENRDMRSWLAAWYGRGPGMMGM